jgi:hypothetical protein
MSHNRTGGGFTNRKLGPSRLIPRRKARAMAWIVAQLRPRGA